MLKGICSSITMLSLVMLTACSLPTSDKTLAPVHTGGVYSVGQGDEYIVQPGDTLYSIAWVFDKDFREIATANNLGDDDTIHPGQHLVMRGHVPLHSTKKVAMSVAKPVIVKKAPASHTIKKSIKKTTVRTHFSGHWQWPTKGKVVQGFSTRRTGNRGINISGRFGQSVKAAAAGKVVYSGSGLRGYGRLIIVKHNSTYLSAYAHNNRLLVKEGQYVRKGQQIATMGRDAKGNAILHFEVRKNGKPVNPKRYL